MRPHRFSRRLVRYLVPALIAVVALSMSMSVPAGAQDTGTLSQISPGLAIVGASVSGNGPEAGRTLDSNQATAFLQAWLPNAVLGTPTLETPPTSLPVYQIEVDYTYEVAPGFITVNYASDGTTAWVALPAQELWPGAVVTPEQGDKWLRAPDGTVAAFHGQVVAETIPTAPPDTIAESSGSSSSDNPVGLVIAVVVAAVVVVGLVVLGVGRRRKTATEVDDGRR